MNQITWYHVLASRVVEYIKHNEILMPLLIGKLQQTSWKLAIAWATNWINITKKLTIW